MIKIIFIFNLILCYSKVYSSIKDTLIVFSYEKIKVPVNIKYSINSKATIIALPGWNLLATDWCTNTSFCEKATKNNFNIVLVEMQKSVYLKEYYPQTRKDYKKYPTRKWLYEKIIKFILQKNIIPNQQPIYVLGLSTGARGAAILALEYPEIIKAAACLSGDYDPLLQKNDLLMINSIGDFNKYQKFWIADNNITLRVSEFKVPLYVGHGIDDKVVPFIQSKRFVETIKLKNPTLKLVEHFLEKMEHNYIFWNSEIDSILAFFNSI